MAAIPLTLDGKALLKSGLGIPILIIIFLAMTIFPLPPFLLDFAFTFNIALALIVLLASVYAKSPMDFSSFPSVLLIATLLRLALNIASTRVVLLNGQNGPGAAGDVIHSFGEVVIGGNYAVGLVVFSILVVINFVVVTKGAGRISEVSARFTLDALPGKQMAVDADLNAGIIDQKEAKKRREDIAQEADFYGSMDGASKFVRGDAVAGIFILLINLIGGLAIGILQHQMPFTEATQVYALLTIGDGLVAQVPSILLSTAAAIMVTRISSEHDIADQILLNLFRTHKPLYIAALIVFGMGILPGMPHIPFLSLAVLLGVGGYWKQNGSFTLSAAEKETAQQQAEAEEEAKKEEKKEKELTWDDVPGVDAIGLEVGYRLIPLVDKHKKGELLNRIKGVRKKLSQELGFLIPSVHIRDNLDLAPNAYRLALNGVTVGESQIHPDKELAINPGQVYGKLNGIETKDPAFGLDAIWIENKEHEHAQSLGFTVVDASTVIATHLSEILQGHASELLGHDEVQKLLDILAKSSPKLVEDLVPQNLPLSAVAKVLQNLLREKIPIRDIKKIIETLAECAPNIKETNILTAHVREALASLIVQQLVGAKQEIPVATLEPKLEQILQESLGKGGGEFAIEPLLAEKIQASLADFTERQEIAGDAAILLVSPMLRGILSKLYCNSIKGLNVLSYNEIPHTKSLKILLNIGAQ